MAKEMSVQELYDKLVSKDFQDPANGDLFYNFFIFQYPVEKEASMRRDIMEFKDNLIRPVNFIDVLTLDIFEVFCKYLDQRSFGNKNPSTLKYQLEKDVNGTTAEIHNGVTRSLSIYAQSEDFMKYVHELILAHIGQPKDGKTRPYVFLYGFTEIYPYLRANRFLNVYEQFNKANRYKIILFYPGEFRENRFSLFAKLNDDPGYRAHILVNN